MYVESRGPEYSYDALWQAYSALLAPEALAEVEAQSQKDRAAIHWPATKEQWVDYWLKHIDVLMGGAMMAKWTGLEKPISKELADAEPEVDRIFGPSYEARQRRLRGLEPTIDRVSYRPWKKPQIERAIGDALEAAVLRISAVAQTFSAEAVDAAATFATGAGKATGIIGQAVEGFVKLADFKGLSDQAIAAFGVALQATALKISTIAENFTQAAVDAAATFAAGAGKAVAIIGQGIEASSSWPSSRG